MNDIITVGIDSIPVVFNVVLLAVFFLAGFFLGVIYSENAANERHKLWRNYLIERKRDEEHCGHD